MKKYIQKVAVDRMIRTISKFNVIRKRYRSKQEPMTKSLVIIDDVLKDARHLKLEAEVVAFALMYMRDNPGATLSEAILSGHDRWII